MDRSEGGRSDVSEAKRLKEIERENEKVESTYRTRLDEFDRRIQELTDANRSLNHGRLVAEGTLDADPGVTPMLHIYVGSKAPWHEITDALPQYVTEAGKAEV